VPLPPPAPRDKIHDRHIHLEVFQRQDGLYDVEGRVLDTKPHAFRRLMQAQDTPAGTPLHDISVRLVIDEDLVVHDLAASSDSTPYPVCREATATLAPLKGMRIGAGWNRRVREVLGGAASCTHIAELMGPLATAAIQGLTPRRRQTRPEPVDATGRPTKIDSCYAYASHQPVVKFMWPGFHQSRAEAGRVDDTPES
jgi:hypothetical protein